MKRLIRIFIWILVGISALIGLLFVFVQSPTGQDFLTKKVVSYLQDKLKTTVYIKKVRFHIPDWISLEGVYVEDQKKDTLLAGGRMHVDIDMLALLQNKVELNQIELEGIRVKVSRVLPDTTFNFAYILKAFDSGPDADTTAVSTPFDISLRNVLLNKVKVTYKDAVIGTDADFYLNSVQTRFEKFNIAKSQYHFSTVRGDGAKALIRMYQPLRPSPVVVEASSPGDTLDLNLGEVSLANVNWLMESSDGSKNGGKVGKIEADGDKFYLAGQKVSFKRILLENTEAFVEVAKQPKKDVDSTSQPNNWVAIIGNTELNKVHVRYDDFNSPSQPKGLDYSHLDLKNIGVNLKNFIFSPNEISGQLTKGAFSEKSGLNVQALTANFSYTDKALSLKNLLLKTPNTLLRDELQMEYNSVEDFSKNIGGVRIKLNLKQSQLAIKDLLTILPDLATTSPFKDHPNDILKADGVLSGTVNNMSIQKFSLVGFDGTKVQAKGRITGLPNTDKLGFDLAIDEISTTKKDIIGFMGDNALPASIELPERVTIKGLIKGKIQNLQLDAAINTDLGNGSFKGKLVNITADRNQQYDGRITLQDFDVGKFIKQPENVGKVSVSANIKGSGIDPKTMQATIDGVAEKAVLKGYEYNNLTLKGNIQNQIADFVATSTDQNADFTITSRVDLAQPYPAVEADLLINNIDFKKLNLYAEDLILKGDIQVNMTSTDPANPAGKIIINKAIVERDGKSIPLDSIDLNIQDVSGRRDIVLKSPFLNAQIKGNFNYTEIPDILLTEVNKYFALPTIAYKPVTGTYDFSVNATINQHPILQTFAPGLTKMDSVKFVAELDSRKDTTLQFTLLVPFIEYDTSRIRNTRLNVFAVGNKAFYSANVGVITYDSYRVRRTSINGEIANNMLTTKLLVKDSLNVDRYALAARVQSIDGKYRMNLSENGTLIDYKPWQSDSTGYVEYNSQGVYVNKLLLVQKGQRLLINSIATQPNSPLQIQIDSLDIKPFVTLVTLDSTLAGGKLNGDFKLANYTTTPSFVGDLVIKNFTFTQIPIGNLTVNATNETADRISTKATILSAKNDIRLDGNYLLKTKNSLDFQIAINKLGAETVQAFSFGQLKDAKGNIRGNLSLKGEPSKPILNGEVRFDSVSLSLTQLGAKYIIRNQTLAFKNSDVKFNRLIIADTLGQNLVVTGNLNLQNIPDFTYEFDLSAKDFMVLNGSRKDNDFFYGKGFIDATLNVRGKGTRPSIDGSIKLKQGSDITVILPDQSIEKTETDGIVQFVNLKDPNAAKLALLDSTEIENTFDFAEEMSLNIEADDKSQLTIVIDELNGDNLKVNGNVQLNAGITPSGQLYLFGLYELTSGKYDLTFQVLKRQFTIQKGSTLLWSGDPMNARIDITAVYPIMAELTSLSEDAKVYGKVPINVLLNMQGNLSNPTIDFKIEIDKTKTTSDVVAFVEKGGFLTNLENDPVQMNKEVFSLLILNRFSGQQSADFFSGINTEAIARQSVSKLLTDQLNILASDLIKGVKLDFNLNSANQVIMGGGSGNRTDLNIGLSKAFLNDRLTVSVGRNFQLENTTGVAKNSTEIFDNIALNYNLSKDGRYMFRAYRKNEYFILDGYIQETGVSFAITLDYEHFKELFK